MIFEPRVCGSLQCRICRGQSHSSSPISVITPNLVALRQTYEHAQGSQFLGFRGSTPWTVGVVDSWPSFVTTEKNDRSISYRLAYVWVPRTVGAWAIPHLRRRGMVDPLKFPSLDELGNGYNYDSTAIRPRGHWRPYVTTVGLSKCGLLHWHLNK